MNDRLKVLLLAPGCDGTDVGESWSCYQWVNGLSQHCDVTLLTLQRPGRRAIQEQLPGIQVVSWPDLHWSGKLERFSSMLKPGYVRFYRATRSWIRKALAQGQTFDLIHQLGPLALRYPCPAVGFEVPLIIGPLAGSLETPAGFAEECGQAPWFTKLRNLDPWRLKIDPWLRRSYAAANVVIGVAPYVREHLGSIPIQRFELASETGVQQFASHRVRRATRDVKLLYVGRVVRTKGLRDAIRAMSHLRDIPGLTLDAIGVGEDLDACQQLARELSLEHHVRFHGRLPRAEVDRFYAEADLFVFPSFREPSGNVVFEALSYGLPVITTDRGGPGYVVNDQCGVRVQAISPGQLAEDLAKSIRRLAASPAVREGLSLGAIRRSREIGLWDNKIQKMLSLYQSVVSHTPVLTGIGQ